MLSGAIVLRTQAFAKSQTLFIALKKRQKLFTIQCLVYEDISRLLDTERTR